MCDIMSTCNQVINYEETKTDGANYLPSRLTLSTRGSGRRKMEIQCTMYTGIHHNHPSDYLCQLTFQST